MKTALKNKFLATLTFILVLAFSFGITVGEKKKGSGIQNMVSGFRHLAKTMPEGLLITASSAVGSPAYHRHLVRPGSQTTYMLRVLNTEDKPVSVNLDIKSVTPGWTASLAESKVSLKPGGSKYVMLTLKSSAKLPLGDVAQVKVGAETSTGKTDETILNAEVTKKHKIYIVSIDSLGPEYLKLNAIGNGWGSEGNWLMPNLHALIPQGVYYPEHMVHLISATDGNHATYLSGAYPGRLGIYSVQIFFFGFDAKGRPISKTTPIDIMYYGKDGKPVTTIFNVVKDPKYGGNPNAFTAYSSGKAWVPEHYRNPIFGLDRIATVDDYADYIAPYPHPMNNKEIRNTFIKIHYGKIKNPDLFLWEDIYTIDQTIETIDNEDPDVFYILLGAVDMAGHTYGAAWDLDEWDDRGTPDDLSDDISKINKSANREAIIKTVKSADEQLGRFIQYLKKRGTYEDSIIVVESDHNMETNLFAGPPVKKILKKSKYSGKKDYRVATLSQIGMIFLHKQDNPDIVPELEGILETYQMKNPLTGKVESPMIVMTREEMRTGIDNKTGKRVTLPGEVYNEYYIDYPESGKLQWPDIMLFIDEYYQFSTIGFGLANVGAAEIPMPPGWHVFTGGHGSTSTQSALLTMIGPGIPKGLILTNRTWAADVIPTLYRIEGYKIPESVQGKGLPKVDPTMQ